MKTAGSILQLIANMCCVVMFLLVFFEVTLRIFGRQFFLSYEYCGFLLGGLIFFTLPIITFDETHLSAANWKDAGNNWLAWLRRSIVRLLVFAYLAALSYFCIAMALRSYRDGTRSLGILMTPLYIPQTAVAVGALMAATFLLSRMFARGKRG